MTVAGIDGCKKGWIMVKYNESGYDFGIFETLTEVFEVHGDIERLLIDMPVGLSSASAKRTIDQTLRRELKGRSSTVFTPPCREALAFLSDFEKTKQKNIEIEGKSLSIQSLNISNKIKELDDLLLNKKHLKTNIIESHPEFCFKYLNGDLNKNLNTGKVLLSKKTTLEGQQERLAIFQKYDMNLNDLFQKIIKNTLRKDAQADDVIDAICLCLVNRLSGVSNLSFLTDENVKDEHDISLRIAYYHH